MKQETKQETKQEMKREKKKIVDIVATNILASRPPNGHRLQHIMFVPIENTRLLRIKERILT